MCDIETQCSALLLKNVAVIGKNSKKDQPTSTKIVRGGDEKKTYFSTAKQETKTKLKIFWHSQV